MSLTRRGLFVAAGLAPVNGSRASAPNPASESAEVWARTELYFGTNRLNNEPVSLAEFLRFIDAHVTVRFPDGLTLLDAYGQYRNSSGEVIRERSFLLILLYPQNMRDANDRIQDIRELYKSAFGQTSVLRVDGSTSRLYPPRPEARQVRSTSRR